MKRGFYWLSKSWYSGTGDPEIVFGLYDNRGISGGKVWMGKVWMDWKKGPPQLQVFDGAWGTLATFGDLLEKMAKMYNPTEEDFVKLLLECGFEDLTTYDNPYGPQEPPQDKRIYNRRREDGTFPPLKDFFNRDIAGDLQ